MDVYIEYVIIDNLIIDYLLLTNTYRILRIKTNKAWIFFCAILGTIFAIVLPIINLKNVYKTIIKLIFSFMLVFISARFKRKRDFAVALIVFNLYTFLLGGGIIGIFNVFSIPYTSEISVGIIILSAWIICKTVFEFVKFFYKKRNVTAFVVDCELELNGIIVKTQGFMDTGNNLYDRETNLPIIICSKEVAIKLMGDFRNKTKGKYVEISTISGSQKILTFKIDKLKIYNGDKPNIFNNVIIGISNTPLKDYSVILHSEIIGGSA